MPRLVPRSDGSPWSEGDPGARDPAETERAAPFRPDRRQVPATPARFIRAYPRVYGITLYAVIERDTWIPGIADDLAALFEILGETSRDLRIGTLILVDELQEATEEELTAVNTAVHQLGQESEPPPVMFVGAGLPSLPAQLADATSYAERLYDYRPVGLLSKDAACAALVRPSQELGVEWDDDALEQALDVARGYPYLLQAVGKHVWDAARRSPIASDDVALGGELARSEVDEGLYRSRWERATPAQKELLRALGETGGEAPAAISDLVAATGKRRVSDLSVARNELIKKGLVYSPARGLLAFTVPGMSDFIARQP